MCLVCFTVAGTLAVGSQIVPITTDDYKSAVPYQAPYSVGQLQQPSSLAPKLSSSKSDPVESCRIEEASQNRQLYGDKNYTQAGFPVSRLTPNSGVVKWALVPIEFKDLKGDSGFRARVNDQMRLLSDWYSTVSGGKLRIQWVVLNKWATLPKNAKAYKVDRSVNLGDDPNGVALFRDAMAATDPQFDFTGVQTVNFILPKGQKFVKETVQGFPWDEDVKSYKTQEGSIASFSIAGEFFDQPNRTYWSYWAHEFGHAIALPHVGASRGSMPPFNPWDLMGGQDGPSRELSGWLRMLAGWLSDSQVYCKEASSIKTQNLNLVPLSGSQKGIKLAILKLSSTKALLIESRRETKFECKTGRTGVLVYLYNARLGHGDNFLTPVTPNGREPEYTNCAVEPHPNPLLRAGDKVSVSGLTVEVLRQGRSDTVRVSRTN